MIRLLLALLLGSALIVAVPQPALAACPAGTTLTTQSTQWGVDIQICVADSTEGEGSATYGEWRYYFGLVCELPRGGFCPDEIRDCQGDDGQQGRLYDVTVWPPGQTDPVHLGERCYYPRGPSIETIRNAIARLVIPQSAIELQPPGGRTLVNLATVMSTGAAPYVEQVRIHENGVEADLEVRFTPVRFAWVHGDGTTRTTEHPGRAFDPHTDQTTPLPDDLITHTYTAATDAALTVRVDVTWSAAYRLGGAGEWQPIAAEITRPGLDASLEVVEARLRLVG